MKRRTDLLLQDVLLASLGDPSPQPGGDARDGAVLWVADPAGPAPQLPLPVERVDPGRLHPEPDLAVPARACVIDGALDTAADPGSLLAWAYRRLRPGGTLILSAAPAPGETLQALLFREGFEAPRLRAQTGRLIASARRSALAPPPQRRQRLSVIMPVFNEVATFQTTMEQVLAKQIPGVDIDIVCVESNSSDGTREKVLEYAGHPRVEVILEERPQGKGHAVRTGLAAARGDFLLIQDADMEYDVDDYDALLAPLRNCEVGFVLGMRTNPNGKGMRDFGQLGFTSRVMNLGHVGFLTLFNLTYGQRLKDPFTMYKVFRRDCLHGLVFECNRFDFDWELTAKLVRAGYHPREIPVTYRSRGFGEGKKVSFLKDPLTWVRACFRYRFSDLYPESPAGDPIGERAVAISGVPDPASVRTREDGGEELLVDPPQASKAGIAS